MSYEIVKGLKIDTIKGEVRIKSDSSNVFPKTFEWWVCKPLSEILVNKGLEPLEKEILWLYFIGEFQKTENDYEKSLILLDNKKYNWGTTGDDREISEADAKEELYKNYQNFKNRRKGNFIISYNGKPLQKFTLRRVTYARNESECQVFKSKEDAQFKLLKMYDENNRFSISEI